jgi:probable F420-dependent oxidoreductase
MDVGMVQLFDGTEGRGLDHIRAYATTVERLGFSSLWVPDHVIFFDRYESPYPHSDDGSIDFKTDQGLLEPLMSLLAAALVTERIRLGTSVDILTERHPIIRGRELATLDHASGGRVEYGIGSGWSREEYAAMGVTFERRGARLNEYIDALRALWQEARPTFIGEFVSFEPLIFMPKPVRGTIPIVIGGNSPAALRRAASRGDGWHGWRLEPDELKRTLDDLHTELERHGRDRADVKLNVGIPFKGPLDELASYADVCRELGIDELVIAAGVSRSRFEQQLADLADAAGVRS